jgi:hypothetical protein
MTDSILFYDSARYRLTIGNLAGGVFSETWECTTLNEVSLGSFVHVAGAPDRTLFYNENSGQARVFALGSGETQLLAEYRQNYPLGVLSKFWSRVLPVGDSLFFYNSSDGSAALASVATGQVVTSNSFAPGSFSSGWTHLAAMGNTLSYK